MKVALLGNMNNLMFSVTRHLRDRGVDADLLAFDDDPKHFHPSLDTFSLDYQRYFRSLPWGTPERCLTVSKEAVARTLAPYDVLVGCGAAPAFAFRGGRTLDLFIPYGSDLTDHPFRLPRLNRRSLRSVAAFPILQRQGLRRTRAVLGDPSVAIEPMLERLDYPGQRIVSSPPLVHPPTYTPELLLEYQTRCHWFQEVRALREEADVLVFTHGRHLWKSLESRNSTKGTDIALQALAQAARAIAPKKLRCVTFEYGPDVDASRALAKELGLEDHILWLPFCGRKEIMTLMSVGDFCLGEFGPSYLSCGTIYEALTLGKPLIHNREDSLYAAHYPELYPMCQASTASEIASHIVDFASDPAPFRVKGEQGRQWHEEYGVRRPVDAILQHLQLS